MTIRHFDLTQINADSLSHRRDSSGAGSPADARAPDTQCDNVISLPAIHSSRPANLAPLPASLYSRGIPLEASNPLQSALDVGAIAFWLAYFLLWFGTLAGLILCLFVEFP